MNPLIFIDLDIASIRRNSVDVPTGYKLERDHGTGGSATGSSFPSPLHGLPRERSLSALSRPEDRTGPHFEAEVRIFLAQHSEPDAAAGSRMMPGVRGNALIDKAASARLAANDLSSGVQSRADQGDLAA